MRSFLSLIRGKNLLIIALYQCLLYFSLIVPAFHKAGLQPQLDEILIVLFIFCTLCIAASANTINDILDIQTDQVNRPSGPLVKGLLSPKKALYIYLSFVIIGFVTAIFIAWKIGKLHLIWIYIVMQVLMYAYSSTFKKRGLPGNLIVALSLSFVSLVMLCSEPQIMLNEGLHSTKIIIIGFSIFVFFINFTRELIKDIEDIEGDKASGLSTLPISSGITFTKWVASVSLVILVVCLIIWTFKNRELDFRLQVFPLVILAGPIILTVFKIYKADLKIHFTKISKFLKYIMLLGLLYLFLIIKNYYH